MKEEYFSGDDGDMEKSDWSNYVYRWCVDYLFSDEDKYVMVKIMVFLIDFDFFMDLDVVFLLIF